MAAMDGINARYGGRTMRIVGAATSAAENPV